MSAAEMREAAAKVALDERKRAEWDAKSSAHSLQDRRCHSWAAAAVAQVERRIRALLLPDEEGMVERVARALLVSEREAYANSSELLDEHFEWWRAGRDDPESCVHYSSIGIAIRQARAAIRAINGGEP